MRRARLARLFVFQVLDESTFPPHFLLPGHRASQFAKAATIPAAFCSMQFRLIPTLECPMEPSLWLWPGQTLRRIIS